MNVKAITEAAKMTKSQRACQAISRLALMATGIAFAAMVTFFSLSVAAPTLGASFVIMATLLSSTISAVADRAKMVSNSIKNDQITSEVNYLKTNLEDMSKEVSKIKVDKDQPKPNMQNSRNVHFIRIYCRYICACTSNFFRNKMSYMKILAL